MLKLDKSSIAAVSVENYEIRISRSDYMHILEYLCRVSFLTTLDIYKDYFRAVSRLLDLHKSFQAHMHIMTRDILL